MYIRSNLNCGKKTDQPKHMQYKDVYGNEFENWCGDYVSNDVDCNPVVFTRPPNYLDPIGTFLCASYVQSKWQHRDVNNDPRTLNEYVPSPLTIVSPPYIHEIIDNIGNETGTPPVLVLGLSQDRDLVLFNEANNQYLQLEPNTQVLLTALNS